MLRRLVQFDDDVGIQADSFSRFGTVERLEQRFAEKLGKESAVFMPTGTLANHLAIRKHCGEKSRAVVQEQSHLFNDTGDCVPRLSGINLIPLAVDRPYFTLDELKEAFDKTEASRVSNPIGAVMIESPVLRQMGQIVPFDEMVAITGFCRSRKVPTHLDGARLYMMCAATGIDSREYAACFDTVYVSLHKYFGAPFGAILAGASDFTRDLYHDRRMFGGGLSMVWMAAALALDGTEEFEDLFAAAMAQAADLFERLNTFSVITVGRYRHGSNVFPLEVGPDVNVERFVEALRDRRIFVYPDEKDPSRFHLTVNPTILRRTNNELFDAFRAALGVSRERVPEEVDREEAR
jgi:threonine aldolase